MTDELRHADVVITLKNYYRRRPQPINDAERRGVPIHVLRSNTVSQMESCLADIFGLDIADMDPIAIAMRETEEAIHSVLSGKKSVDLGSRRTLISAGCSTRWPARPTWCPIAMARTPGVTYGSLPHNGI